MLIRVEVFGRCLHIELGTIAEEDDGASDVAGVLDNVPQPMVEYVDKPADPVGFRLWQYADEED